MIKIPPAGKANPSIKPINMINALRGAIGPSPASGFSMIFAIGTYINLAISDSSRFCIKKRKRFSFNSCCRAIERYCFSCVGTDVNLASTASLSRCKLLILISNPFSTLAIANRILFFMSRNCISSPVTIGLLSRAESNNFPLRRTISLYLLIPLFNDSSVSPSCSGNNRNSSPSRLSR